MKLGTQTEETVYGPDSKIYREFVEYHTKHPEVYWQLHALALQWVGAGHNKIGIGMLFEVMRWNAGLRPDRDGAEEFVLNNNYRSHYARLLMDHEPLLVGVFEVRTLRSL